MRDDFLSIASQVHSTTTLDLELCKVAVRDSFRELLERNNWSWLLKRGVITVPAPYTTGFATFTQYSPTVTLSGGAVTDMTMIGRQIRSGTGDPFYTIVDVPSSTTVIIFPAWGGSISIAPATYQIMTAYITPPDDFFSFVTVRDPSRGWLLNLNVDQSMVDAHDPRRASTGQPVLLSPVDYSPSYAGKVYPAVQIVGTGSIPLSGGTFSGSTDALFSVIMLSTGAPGTATFKWSKDGGGYTTSTTAVIGNYLNNGVSLSWPGASYTSGDTFVIRTGAVASPGLPRYEVYPYPSSQTLLYYQYLSRYQDLDEANVIIPRYIPGNVIKEGALGKTARIPGTEDNPNPYAQRARAENHENRFDLMLAELARQDEEIMSRSISYDEVGRFAPLPWGRGMGGRPIDYDPMDIYPI